MSPDRVRNVGGGRANSMATAGKKNVDGSQQSRLSQSAATVKRHHMSSTFKK